MEQHKTKLPTYAAANALLTVLYIILIAFFLRSTQLLFGHGPESMLVPVAMISLFVFSAALTGSLMLGRPILWYMDGRKKEAITLFAYTMAIFLAVTVLIFVTLFLVSRFA